MSKKVKLIFDSDALIKLIKAGLSKDIFDKIKAYISEDVYAECVIEGKKGFYGDANIIEELVKNGNLIKVKIKPYAEAHKLLRENLGKGEKSTLHLFYNIKPDTIISDDKIFLNLLKQNNIPFILPADFVIALYRKRFLDKNQALNVLEGLKLFIKEEYYKEIKGKLGEEK